MSNNINNINNSEIYQYNNDVPTQNINEDNTISIFEEEQTDEESIGIELNQDNEKISEEKIEALENKLSEAKDRQGIFGSLWNGLKNLTGLGTNTNKCEQAIEDYKNGKISYEEADSIISNFSSKQESSVNLAANILTGVVAVAVVGSAVLTGGLSLGVIAAAAGAGAATKAGLKFIDRATNKVEGDALDGKQILKDSLSGAVDGAVSVATMGIGTSAVTAKTVAEQTLKETIKQGAIAGAKAGAISGAVTGASDYTIEAAIEEDVEFNVGDLAKSTALNAAGGALAGGVLGGVSSGIQYNKVKTSSIEPNGNIDSTTEIKTEQLADSNNVETTAIQDIEPKVPDESITNIDTSETKLISTKSNLTTEFESELSKQSEELSNLFESNINQAKTQIENDFYGMSSVEDITARAKSSDSIFKKLIKKFKSNELNSTDTAACAQAIDDGYGTRIQLKSISTEESKELIEDCLYGYDISYDQFIKYINGDTSTLDEAGITTLNEIKGTIIDLLKERQSQEVVDQLVDAIGNGRLTITELNNYGDEISSYFTNSQLQEIAEAYYIQTGKKLNIVTYDDFTQGSGTKFDLNNTAEYKPNIITKGAKKQSGYASSQMKTEHVFSDGTTGKGELQIRGKQLNEFADAEHIPYDIRTGKITASDTKYSDVFNIIKDMSSDTYNSYIRFINDTYKYLRYKELGITIPEPKIAQYFTSDELSQEAIKLIDVNGLIEISKRAK